MSADPENFDKVYKTFIGFLTFLTAAFFYFQLEQISEQNSALIKQNRTLDNSLTAMTNQNEIIARQNETLERTLQQSYRPLGIVRYETREDTYPDRYRVDPEIDNGDQISWEPNPILTKKAFSGPQLTNRGSGILVLFGVIYGYSYEFKEIRHEILSGNPSLILTEQPLKGFAEGTVLLTDEDYELEIEVLFRPKTSGREVIYVSSLIFYEDQDGNLYDTEHIERWPLRYKMEMSKDTVIEGNNYQYSVVDAHIDSAGTDYIRESYNLYTNEQKQKLRTYLRDNKKEMYSIIFE